MANIKNLLGNGGMVYDKLFTEDQFEWFKSNEDAYIYVLNTETKRCTRYNAEAQNGKRISVEEYETKMAEAMLRAAQENGDELTDETIEQAISDFEESMDTEEIAEARESAQETEAPDCRKPKRVPSATWRTTAPGRSCWARTRWRSPPWASPSPLSPRTGWAWAWLPTWT